MGKHVHFLKYLLNESSFGYTHNMLLTAATRSCHAEMPVNNSKSFPLAAGFRGLTFEACDVV